MLGIDRNTFHPLPAEFKNVVALYDHHRAQNLHLDAGAFKIVPPNEWKTSVDGTLDWTKLQVKGFQGQTFQIEADGCYTMLCDWKNAGKAQTPVVKRL